MRIRTDDGLTVSVNVGLSVSDETAQACLKLIELWLNDNPDKCIEGGLRGADGKVEPLLIKLRPSKRGAE